MNSPQGYKQNENLPQQSLATLETDGKLLRLVTAYGILIVAFHLFGCFNPSALLWGTDLFSFLPDLLKVALLILMIAVLFPSVQGVIIHVVSLLTEKLEKISRSRRVVAITVSFLIAAVLFWIGREKVFLLGDGNLVIRLIRDIRAVSDIPPFFKNEPLAGYLIWRIYQGMLHLHIPADEEMTIHVVSIACSLISLVVLWKIARDFGHNANERFFLFLSCIVLWTSQFFFGYVEVYPPLFMTFVLFVWTSFSCLNGTVRIILPSLSFALLLTLHFGMICMLPAMIFLWYFGVKKGHTLEVFESVGATLLVTAGILWLCGYSTSTFWNALLGRERHLLPLTGKIEYWSAYGFLSAAHVIDMINLHLLLFPFALVVGIFLILLYHPQSSDSTIYRFFLLVAVCGLLFTLITNSEIGVSRDWDLFATFVSGVALYSIFTLVHSVRTEVVRHRIYCVIIGITALHTIGWITVNAGEESGVLRYRELPDPRLWGTHAHLSAFEELAIYYRGKHDIGNALDCYNRYLRFDSTKGRIYAAIAHLNDLAGDKKSQMMNDEKAIQYGVSYPDIYVELARLYVFDNRMKEARTVLTEGVEKNPESILSNEYLGTFLISYERNYGAALPYFQKMIRIDSTYPGVYYHAGMCAYSLKDYALMRSYFDTFLRKNPVEKFARQVNEILQLTGNQ